MTILPRSFYKHDTVTVARALLGKRLIRTIGTHKITGIIAETEAYGSHDPASHAFKGKTARNSALFGPVGHSYVYFTYGLHYCLNLVSHDTSIPAGGVLIRAIILDNPKKLIKGPGNVTKALHINAELNNTDVTIKNSVLIATQGTEIPDNCVLITPRIGISKAKEELLRFVIDIKNCPELLL